MDDRQEGIVSDLKKFRPELSYQDDYLKWLDIAQSNKWNILNFARHELLPNLDARVKALEDLFASNINLWRSYVTHLSQSVGYPSLWGHMHPAAKVSESALGVAGKKHLDSNAPIENPSVAESVRQGVDESKRQPLPSFAARISMNEDGTKIRFGRSSLGLPLNTKSLAKWGKLYFGVFDELQILTDEKKALEKQWVNLKTRIGKERGRQPQLQIALDAASDQLRVFEATDLFSKTITEVQVHFDEALIWLPPQLGYGVGDFLKLVAASELIFLQAPSDKELATMAELRVMAERQQESFWSEITRISLVTSFLAMISGTINCVICGQSIVGVESDICQCPKVLILDKLISLHFEVDVLVFKKRLFSALSLKLGKKISNETQFFSLVRVTVGQNALLQQAILEAIGVQGRLFPRKLDSQANKIAKDWKVAHGEELSELQRLCEAASEALKVQAAQNDLDVASIKAIDDRILECDSRKEQLMADKLLLENCRLLAVSEFMKESESLLESLADLNKEYDDARLALGERDFWLCSIENESKFKAMCLALNALSLNIEELSDLTCSLCTKPLDKCRCQSFPIRVDAFLRRFDGISLPALSNLLESNRKRIWGIFHLDQGSIKAHLSHLFDNDVEAFQGLVSRALVAPFANTKGATTARIGNNEIRSLIAKWPGLDLLGYERLNSAISTEFLTSLVDKVKYSRFPLFSARALWLTLEKEQLDAEHESRVRSIPSYRSADSYDD